MQTAEIFCPVKEKGSFFLRPAAIIAFWKEFVHVFYAHRDLSSFGLKSRGLRAIILNKVVKALNLKNKIVICGHYGSGKTTFAVNLALCLAKEAGVTLIDLDIVNPYFRSSDYTDLLEQSGVRVVAPNFAGSTLDTPSLPAEIGGALSQESGYVLIDAGGDDAGATALGCYAGEIADGGYDMLYVINARREQIADPAGAEEILRQIEATSRLRATGVVNNSHLCMETEADTVTDSLPYAKAVCERLGLPLVFTCYPDFLNSAIEGELPCPLPLTPVVKAPW